MHCLRCGWPTDCLRCLATSTSRSAWGCACVSGWFLADLAGMETDIFSATRPGDRNSRDRRARSFENLVSLSALSAFPQAWDGEETHNEKQRELEAELEEERLPVAGSQATHRGPSVLLHAPFRVSKMYRNVEGATGRTHGMSRWQHCLALYCMGGFPVCLRFGWADRLNAVVCQSLQDAADTAAPDERTDRLRELRELLEMPLSDTLRQSLQAAEAGPLRIPTRYFSLLAEMHARVALTNPHMLDLDNVLPGKSTLWSHPEFPCVFFLVFHLAFVGGFHDLELQDEKDTDSLLPEDDDESSPRRHARSHLPRDDDDAEDDDEEEEEGGKEPLHTRPNFELLLLGADQAFFQDVQAHTLHFQDIFSLFLDTAVHPTKLRKLPKSLAQDFAQLVLRYDLYYEPADDLPLIMLRMTVLDTEPHSDRRGQSLLGPAREQGDGGERGVSVDSFYLPDRANDASSIDWPTDADFDAVEPPEEGEEGPRGDATTTWPSSGSPRLEAVSLEDASVPSSFDSLPLQETRRTLQQRATVLVREVSHLLPQVKNEQSLLLILSNLTVLHRIDLNPRASNELQAALQAFLSPGGAFIFWCCFFVYVCDDRAWMQRFVPYFSLSSLPWWWWWPGPLFPSRQVRHVAAEVMEEVFPTGSQARRAVHLAFRLCNPCRWPISFAQWGWQRMRPCRRGLRRVGDPILVKVPCGNRVVWGVEALERFIDWCLGQQEEAHTA